MRKFTKKALGFALAAVLAFGIAGCKSEEVAPEPEPEPEPEATTRIVHDMMGNDVEIPIEVHSIAIATPVHTIFAMASGAEAKLVTCPLSLSSFATTLYPNLAELTNPFANKGANIEELLTINPDVVVLADGISYIEAVEEMGFPVVLIDHYDFDSLLESITTIAEVAGEDEAAKAAEFVAYFRNNQELIANAIASVPESQKTRACYLWGTGSDLTSYGNETVQHALLTAAGAVNVFDYLGSYKGISLEDVIAAAPEVIICSRKADWQEITTADEWKDIPAVAAGRVYYAPKGINSYVAVAPEIALGLVWATQCMYPDQTVDIDMVSMMKDFYKTFMNYSLDDEEAALILAAEDVVKGVVPAAA